MMSRAELEAIWLMLTRETLPALAAQRRATARAWPVVADHCFMRIILDSVHGQRWDSIVTARPAYRHMADDHLHAAITLARQIADGAVDLWALNAKSLAWRGKLVR